MKIFVVVMAFCATALAQYSYPQPVPQQYQVQQPVAIQQQYRPAQQPQEQPSSPKPHNFEYAVKDGPTGNDFGHKEQSDGRTTSGTYYVLLPDGRLQTVTYRDSGDGLVAEVTYQGQAKYPEPNAIRPAIAQAQQQPGSSYAAAPGTIPTAPLQAPSSLYQAPNIQQNQNPWKY